MDDLEWLSDYVVGFMKSPTWVVPIAQFMDDRCDLFDNVVDGDENKLEYTACHQQFQQLVGDLLTAHLLEVSVTTEMFDRFCHQGLNENQELHRVLVEQLLAVDDFLTFKAMMAKQNADLYREVVTLDGEGAFDGDEPLSPTREVASQLVRDAMDLTEWRLYEEQFFGNTEAASMSQEGLEATRRCEEAELQHAIALSLQLEEEEQRIRSMPLEQVFATGPIASSVDNLAYSALPPPENPAVLARPKAFPNGGFASAPLTRLPHRIKPVQQLLREEPMTSAQERLSDPSAAQADAQALRQRAERALVPLRTGPSSSQPAPLLLSSTSAVSSHSPETGVPDLAPAYVPANVALAAAAARAAANGGPSAEERQRRANHLRNQRDRLLQKRREDRGQQVTQAMAGRSLHVAAAVDRALQTPAVPAMGRSASLVSELTPLASGPEAPAHTVAAAEQMRQAITIQLRQNLYRSAKEVGTEAILNTQLDRLEKLQAGACQ